MKRYAVLVLVVFLVLLGVMPVATAKRNGTDRPFKADLVGEVTFEFPSTQCPGPLTVTTSWGTASHLGSVTADWAHCPLDVGFVDGELVVTAANGDELVFEYDNPADDNPFAMTVAGGTGRFDVADGWADIEYALTPLFLPLEVCQPGSDPFNPMCFDLVTPWPWWGWIEGEISY
jgi:hypothetical protein